MEQMLFKAFDNAIFEAKDGMVLLIVLPEWAPTEAVVTAAKHVATNRVWESYSKTLMNIRFLCPTEEMFEGMAAYFQGTWEL